MKLWVDDERPMPEGFDAWAKTAEEAIRMLSTGKFTEVSLDHDLGSTEPSSDGYWIARWIQHAAMSKTLKPLVWRIHSQNPVGAANMRAALFKADVYWNSKQEEAP